MQNDISPENARALLQSTQQLRTHWSGVIVNLINYVIVLNVGIWTIFGKGYIDSLATPCNKQPSYIVLAAFLSSLSLFLWRLYTHYLDNQIAELYPDFLLYEEVLGVPYGHGTKEYLSKNVPFLEEHVFLNHHLKSDEKLDVVKKLIEKKRVGCRGHNVIDIIALAAIFLMLVSSVIFGFNSINKVLFRFDIAYYVFIIIGTIILWLCYLCYFQKDPTEKFIDDTVKLVKEQNDKSK